MGAVERGSLGLCAMAAWLGLALQLYILMTGPLGALPGLWRFLAFFTVLTNIVVAVVATLSLARPAAVDESVRAAAVFYIVIVGLVYVTLLQALWDPQGLQLIADLFLHYATPILALAHWLLFAPKRALRWRDPLIWLAFPALYLGYALVRGAAEGFYAYPFIDAGALGYGRVLANALGFLAAFGVLGVGFVALARLMAPRR